MQMQCGQETQLFQDCLKNTGGDVAPCQSYMDMMMKCKARLCPSPIPPFCPTCRVETPRMILSTDQGCCVCCRVPERLNAATSVRAPSELRLVPAAARGAYQGFGWRALLTTRGMLRLEYV